LYAHTVTYHPIVGRALELRAVVLKRARELNGTGVAASVARSVWSKDFPGVRLTQEFETLAEYEEAQGRGTEASRAFIIESDELIRKPVSPRLFEIVSRTGPPDESPAGWLHELTVFPGIGKVGELRSLMRERDESLDSQRRRSVFAVRLAPGEYGIFVRTFIYPSLSALDDQRNHNASSPDEREHIEREQSLFRKRARSEIWQALSLD
jgi:hypothetical protein